jgi:hypothetical protein
MIRRGAAVAAGWQIVWSGMITPTRAKIKNNY